MLDSIRARLTFWYVLVLALALLGVGSSIYVLLSSTLEDRVDDNLRALISIAATSLSNDLAEGQDVEDAARSTATELATADQMVAIFSPDGSLLAEAGREPDLHVSLPEGVREAEDAVIFTAAEDDEPDDRHRIAAQQIVLRPSGIRYIVMTGSSLEPIDEEIASLRRILLSIVPLMLAIAALGGWILARQSLAPVVAMAQQARRIGYGAAVSERLPVVNPRDELGGLAATFNELLDRLSASLQQQRQFMADASHELRTPVATTRTAANVALQQPHRDESHYRDTLAIVEQQTIRLTRIVEDMFLLARADAGHLPVRKGRMYLDEVLMEVARSARVLSAKRNISIDVSGASPAPMIGDEELIRRLFGNLIDNAVRHSPDGAVVRVNLQRSNGVYAVDVVDQGGGIPTHARDAIFERFFRVDPARSRTADGGAGLGLALARWIARAHGGDVSLVSSGPSGSTFSATLEAGAEVD